MVKEQHQFFEHTLELCGAHAELPIRFICNDKQTQRSHTFLGSSARCSSSNSFFWVKKPGWGALERNITIFYLFI